MEVQDYREHINLVEADIDHEKRNIEAFRQKIVSYSHLKGVTERLSLCLTLEDTSKTLSSEVHVLFGNKETTIILYLFHSKTGELGISSSQKGQMRVNLKDKKGDEFDQYVVKTLKSLLIEDTRSDYRFDIDKIKTEDKRIIRSLISTPLMVGNKALGLIRVDSPHSRSFNTEDLRLLKTVADLGAVAIENAQLYRRVEQLAVKDGLTGLYLRRYLIDRFSEEIYRHMQEKSDMSFLMVDLDHFKQYNDKFGHVAGDIVLRTVGMMFAQFFNEPGVLVCRYGGEEIAVLLPNCSKKEAVKKAEAIRKKVAEQTILLRREKTHITISVGVASFPEDAQTKDELIRGADEALYRAKEKGRNAVCAV
ncbi:MAG: sensor domain-containing diguanylate cyclase [Candidatus Omnitrophica bacterium]|nr:sensor domain-containing diguanylate cyclase [Candidatus Omnitrophota bacterium]